MATKCVFWFALRFLAHATDRFWTPNWLALLAFCSTRIRRTTAFCAVQCTPTVRGVQRTPFSEARWQCPTAIQPPKVSANSGSCCLNRVWRFPGFPSVDAAPRVSIAHTRDVVGSGEETLYPVPHVPVLPVSWTTAQTLMKSAYCAAFFAFCQRLFAAMRGVAAPGSWVGAMRDVPYNVGGTDDVTVRLVVSMNDTITPIWNVLGRIDGQSLAVLWFNRVGL